MSAPVFIGDELTAAGFRLAGASVRVPAPEETADVLREALNEAQLVVLTAGCAQHVPETVLQEALRSPHHLVAIVPDAVGMEPPSLRDAVHRSLGIVA